MTSAEKFRTIDAYIDSYPPNVQTILRTLRQTVHEEAPNAQETIKYGMPTFTLRGNLVYFAAWKQHISLYPITHAMEDAIEEIAAYKTSGKGTIQFPLSQPLPMPLIRRIVQFRLQEQQEGQR